MFTSLPPLIIREAGISSISKLLKRVLLIIGHIEAEIVTWPSLAFLKIIGISPAMGNFFSQARDDRTYMSMFRPSRRTNSSNKLSSPSEAIIPSRNKTLDKTLKVAKPYNISRPTRPDHLHQSAKCAVGPPRPQVLVSSDRGMDSPAELQSGSFYEFCFPEFDEKPPKVNYERKPTLQPQGAPAQAPIPLTRTGPEQPLTPPPTPGAVLAPPLPPRPPHAQQLSAMAVPLPGNLRYLEVSLGKPLVPEPSWGLMDAKREEVMLMRDMVGGPQVSRKFFFRALGDRTNLLLDIK